jgi:hypothetical protein
MSEFRKHSRAEEEIKQLAHRSALGVWPGEELKWQEMLPDDDEDQALNAELKQRLTARKEARNKGGLSCTFTFRLK